MNTRFTNNNTCVNNNSHALTRPKMADTIHWLISDLSSPRWTQKFKWPTCKCPAKKLATRKCCPLPPRPSNSWQQWPKGTFFQAENFHQWRRSESGWRHFSGNWRQNFGKQQNLWRTVSTFVTATRRFFVRVNEKPVKVVNGNQQMQKCGNVADDVTCLVSEGKKGQKFDRPWKQRGEPMRRGQGRDVT